MYIKPVFDLGSTAVIQCEAANFAFADTIVGGIFYISCGDKTETRYFARWRTYPFHFGGKVNERKAFFITTGWDDAHRICYNLELASIAGELGDEA